MSVLDARVRLSEEVSIPPLGLGVFQVPPDEAQRVVEDALAVGYRHIDTAAAYVNESGVGGAWQASGLDRGGVFLTSKLRNGEQGFDTALRAYDDSCARMQVDHLDLYLIHWPNPQAGLWQDSWRALERLLDEGRVGAIGVSNFMVEHLQELASFASHLPAVNQIEVHPAFQQAEVQETCRRLGIAVEAYSPLGQGAALTDPTITGIAAAHAVTTAQVVLRWHLQHERVVIPKTTSRERMASNADLGFELSADEMSALDRLESGERTGNDPYTFALSQIR